MHAHTYTYTHTFKISSSAQTCLHKSLNNNCVHRNLNRDRVVLSLISLLKLFHSLMPFK